VLPEAAKLTEPSVHLLKRRSVDGINATGPVDADSGKPALAQDLQMLGHGCLRNAELAFDYFNDVSSTALTLREKLKDAASNRVA